MAWTLGTSSAALLREAADQPSVFLPQPRPRLWGSALALASLALGVWSQSEGFPAPQAVGVLALAGVAVGLLLHHLWQQLDSGWRLHFGPPGRLEPVGTQRGEAWLLQGEGWSIHAAPGSRRHQVAIDLHQEGRGPVARLLDQPARRMGEVRRVCALADLLAQRLGVERAGLRLSDR